MVVIDYELVRIYHPDSAHGSSLLPESRHKRFQSISAAYDFLRANHQARIFHAMRKWMLKYPGGRKAFYAAASAKGNWDDATYRGDHSYDSAFGRERWKSSSAEDAKIDGAILWGSAFVSDSVSRQMLIRTWNLVAG